MYVRRDSFWGYSSLNDIFQRWNASSPQGNFDSGVTRFGVGTSYRNNIAGFGTDVVIADSGRNESTVLPRLRKGVRALPAIF